MSSSEEESDSLFDECEFDEDFSDIEVPKGQNYTVLLYLTSLCLQKKTVSL